MLVKFDVALPHLSLFVCVRVCMPVYVDLVMVCACIEPFFCRCCPCCKKHQQARKKLELWRLPEVHVIHLKRFSYNRFMKNKLETFVEFPIHDNWDLSAYIAHRTEHPSDHYRLYAVSNPSGNMEGGHYTA